MTEERTRPSRATPADVATSGLEALTEEVLPALIVRLRASRLAELEVRSEGWRVRLRRDPEATRSGAASSAGGGPASSPQDDLADAARSPAVGYFSPAALLAVGRSVQPGDVLGSVDVLGISQDVSAPAAGIVSAVLAEPGQAVEYGQVLARIDVMAGGLDDGRLEAGDEPDAGEEREAP